MYEFVEALHRYFELIATERVHLHQRFQRLDEGLEVRDQLW